MIKYLALAFILLEVYKLIFIKKHFENINKSLKQSIFTFINGMLYLVFVIYIMFQHYFFIGLGILMMSIITAISIKNEQMILTKKMYNILICDGVASIILLIFVVIKEFNLI